MQKQSLIVGVVALVVGLFVGGYAFPPRVVPTHVMPDGSMMAGHGSMDMDDMMEVMNAELRGKSGDEFDQAFLREMIVHHEGAVEMADLALANAKHQEIKDLARAIVSAQNKEIADMRSWLASWYGNN